jgi:hypothetical protein
MARAQRARRDAPTPEVEAVSLTRKGAVPSAHVSAQKVPVSPGCDGSRRVRPFNERLRPVAVALAELVLADLLRHPPTS